MSVPADKAAPESGAGQFDEAALLDRIEYDDDLFRELKQAALEDVPLKITALREAVDNEDKDAAERAVHSIKGAALNLCFTRLADLARNVQEEAGGKKMGHLASLCKEVEQEWGAIAELLKT